MKLQILIPRYNEGEEVLRPLLNSLAMQENVRMSDFGVIICDDGSDTKLSERFFDNYPFEIEYHYEEHKGVSATRNACLDYATADYVMFCDADDIFYSLCGLFIIMREIEFGFDGFVSEFIQETRTTSGEVVYLSKAQDTIFVHGKVFRRAYLIENNIRFNPTLQVHEDSYFVILAERLTTDLHYCPHSFYLWKYRKDSICRRDNLWVFKTYPQFIDSEDELVNQFLERDRRDLASAYASAAIFDAYYAMNKPQWIYQENKEYRLATETRLKEFYFKYKDLWNEISQAEKMKVSIAQRERNIKEGMPMETMTIEDWLQHITEL